MDRFALVGVNAGAGTGDADYAGAVDRILELGRHSNKANEVATLIIVALDEGIQHPNALWRKRLADATKQFRKLRFCLVTDSAVATGIFRIIEWLAPKRAGVATTTRGSMAEAVLWAENDAGCRLPFLFDLYGRARYANDVGLARVPQLRSVRSA